MLTLPPAERDNYLRWNGRKAGVYEVYYLKLNDPQTRTGFWLRYTLTSPVEGEARAELWGVVFDPELPSPQAFKETHPYWHMGFHGARFQFRIGEAELTHGSARGALRAGARRLGWELAWQPSEKSVRHFGYDWMYRGPWPKTKVLSPNPSVKVSGTIVVGDKTYTLTDAPAQQGHIWGVRHAERWVWAQCCAFSEDPGAVFEGLSASPDGGREFSTFFFRVLGRDYELNKISNMLWSDSAFGIGHWDFTAEGQGYRFIGRLSAPVDRIAGVTYTGPTGDVRICNNSSVADCQIEVQARQSGAWATLTKLSSSGMAAMETAARLPHPSVPVLL